MKRVTYSNADEAAAAVVVLNRHGARAWMVATTIANPFGEPFTEYEVGATYEADDSARPDPLDLYEASDYVATTWWDRETRLGRDPYND